MASRKLVIEVVGDASKLDRTFKQAATSTTKFGRALDGLDAGRRSTGGLSQLSALTKGGAIALGAGVAAQQLVKLTDAASDLNEQITKSQQVFGASSDAVERWSTTTARGLGISRTAALEATGTFGNLFSTVGLQSDQAADMSKALVQLAADLASFNNADPSDVLDALRSGLVGEAEPLRRFGVLLSEARVQQRAMADSGKDTAKALTQQEKTLARYELILGDTKKAQGDFARTSGGLANQQRILKAQLADTQAEIGTKLLPVMVELTGALNDAIGAADGLARALDKIKGPSGKDVFGDLSSGIKDALQFAGIFHEDILAPSALSAGVIAKAMSDAAKDAAFLSTFKIPEPPKFPKRPEEGDRGRALPPAFGEPGFKVGKASADIDKLSFPKGITAEQRNRFFDDLIGRKEDRVQDIKSLQGQVKELATIEGLIQQRIDATKDITRRLNLEDELVRVRRQRKSVVAEIADQQAQAAQDAAEKVRAAKERQQQLADELAKRVQVRQSTALGDVTPGVDNLRKQLESLSSRIDERHLKLGAKLGGALEGARRILSGELGKATEESRQRIQELFDTIRGEFDKQGKKGPLTKTTSLNTNKVLKGLGLSPADERELKARLSHFNSAGRALAAAGSQRDPNFRGTSQDVKFSIAIDGRPVEHSVTKNQQKRARANPPTRRGR